MSAGTNGGSIGNAGNAGMKATPVVDYLAGGWVGIVGPGTWLLIESDPSVPFVQQCWRLVRDGAGASKILAAIHGQTADEVRDFALVCVNKDSTHAAARGCSSIRLQANENGPVTLVLGVVSGSAGPAQTVDRLYDWSAVTFQLAVGYESAWPPRENQPPLPLTAGAVLAAAISGRPQPQPDEGAANERKLGEQTGSARGRTSGDAKNAKNENYRENGNRENGNQTDREQGRGIFAIPAPGSTDFTGSTGSTDASSTSSAPESSSPPDTPPISIPAPPIPAPTAQHRDERENRNNRESTGFELREFDFELTPGGSAAGRSGGDPFVATPLFADEVDGPDAGTDEADPGRLGRSASDSEVTGEHEFGFASAPTAPEPADDDLFTSTSLFTGQGQEQGQGQGQSQGSTVGGKRSASEHVADEAIMAELTGSFKAIAPAGDPSEDDPESAATLFIPTMAGKTKAGAVPPMSLSGDEIEADDPDFAPTMLVPSRPVMPPIPAPVEDKQAANEEVDPDFAPTMLVPAKPKATPPIPVPGNENDKAGPDFTPTMLVPTQASSQPPLPAPNNEIDPQDPDFAPTMLVPARPKATPPEPTVGGGQEQVDPDFAPTMLVPTQKSDRPDFPAPAAIAVQGQPAAGEFAPPVGPRFDVGGAAVQPGPGQPNQPGRLVPAVQDQPIALDQPVAAQQPGQDAGADSSAGQESDADLIWKLDWWDSNHSNSDSMDLAPPPNQVQSQGQSQSQSQDLSWPAPAQLPPQYSTPMQGLPQIVPQPPHLAAPEPAPQTQAPRPQAAQAPQIPAPQPPAAQPTAYQVPTAAAGWPTPAPAPAPANPAVGEEDTSMTVPRPSNQSTPESDAAGRPLVPAVRCPAGHLNPPQATRCRVCAVPVPPQASYQIPQPVLGILRLSTGGDVPLDRDVFLGRDPGHTEERKARKPHMLRLPSPGKDISRDHLEIRLVGWRVMVIDLGSTNGTTVIVPGGRPEPLAPGGSRMIEPGTQVVLAEEVSLVYEVTS
jgi:hypothetical protein